MVYVLLALVLLGVWLFCLFDVLSTDEGDVRHLPKFGWFLIVLLGALAGAGLWLALGRPRRPLVGTPGGPAIGDDRPDAPKGPDDDPAFLRDLERRLRGGDDNRA